jgi:YHS domain-containing protein
MVKVVLYLFLAIILISFLRSVIGVVMKAISGFVESGGSPSAPSGRDGARSGGELKRDPVCGTYVSAAASVKKTVDGEVVHFCSDACRDKYKA